MKILVLGATGMLGHKLMQVLANKFEVMGTVRQGTDGFTSHPVLGQMQLVGGIDAANFDSVINAMANNRPPIVINCIGIIKQVPAGKDPLPSITINALFPHRLAQLCRAMGTRLIHISTDCVFSGEKGNYTEDDLSDAKDLYGRTKFLGEVAYLGCLTLRTSIIGRELNTRFGLLEWFLSQQGNTVSGYTKAIYSGFTTLVLAELIADVIAKQPDLNGVWHVSSDPISKFDLLRLIKEALNLQIGITPDHLYACDRSLDSTRFRQMVGYIPPDWPQMVSQITSDLTRYDDMLKG